MTRLVSTAPAFAIMLLGIVGAGPDPPRITKMEIVPSLVVVGSDPSNATSFEVEVRLWTGEADRVSIVDGYLPQWTASAPWIKLVSSTGFRARFEIEAGALPSGSAPLAYVQVTAGGMTTEPGAKIVFAPDVLSAADGVIAAYDPDRQPTAVVVSADRGSSQDPCMSVSTLVRRAMLGPLVAKCSDGETAWGVAVLSKGHSMVLTPPVTWTSTPDPVIDVSSQQTPRLAVPLALHVMVAPGPDDDIDPVVLRDSILKIAKDDIKAADSLLDESRAGIALDLIQSETIDTADEVKIANCPAGDTVTAAHDVSGVLNVYYVNDMGNYRGRACDRHDTRKQDVVYVVSPRHQSTTLAHEIGHALGLFLPGQGHTDKIGGLDRTNIMTSGDQDTDPAGRHRLTVGQVFRMNADSASWLTWAADKSGNPLRDAAAVRVRCTCGSDDPATACPGLGDDVAARSDRSDGINAWDCSDEVIFYEVPETEQPVAVVAGRRWGTDICRTDVPGETEHHFEATFVRFDNLTRPGQCPAWAAVFFKERAVLFLPLAEPDVGLTQGADEIVMGDPIPDRLEVPVHLYYASSDQSEVRREMAHAAAAYGPSNRSGILLQFDENENVGCPQNSPAKPAIEVCYLSTGTDEATLTGRHIDILGGRGTTTLSHYLGLALGLSELTSAATVPSANVMQADAAARGTKLTLSQVFQISAELNPALCGTATCPVLSPDVNP